MSELLEKCTVCGALLDEEDLFCANCGTEAPHPEATALAAETSTHVFRCNGCGASMSYDANAQSLRCPFCGSEKLEAREDELSVAPKYVIPAAIDRGRAETELRRWLGSGFWRPSDLSSTAVVVKIVQVYVPFWVFRATTFTYWTADSNRTPPGARGDWFPVSGDHRGEYAGLLVGASSVLTPAEIAAIEPFDFSAAVARDAFDLDGVTYERFMVARRYARPTARWAIENLERQACAKYVPGSSRNVKVNVRFEGLASDPVLLPFWILAYSYKGTTHRFLMNGQTGRSTGTAPISNLKIAAAIGIGLAVVAGLLACAGAFAGLAAL